ncbi:unnamed protein product, partial [Rangifer tarandus platyrhynchus]
TFCGEQCISRTWRWARFYMSGAHARVRRCYERHNSMSLVASHLMCGRRLRFVHANGRMGPGARDCWRAGGKLRTYGVLTRVLVEGSSNSHIPREERPSRYVLMQEPLGQLCAYEDPAAKQFRGVVGGRKREFRGSACIQKRISRPALTSVYRL